MRFIPERAPGVLPAILFACVFLISCRAAAQQAEVVVDSATVYSQMSSESEIVETLAKGQGVSITFSLQDKSGRWCNVARPGNSATIGWVRCSQLSQGSQPAPVRPATGAAAQVGPSARQSIGVAAGQNVITTAVGAPPPEQNAALKALEDKVWSDMQQGKVDPRDVRRLQEERRKAFLEAGGDPRDFVPLAAAAMSDLVTGEQSSQAVLAAIVQKMVQRRQLSPVGDGGPALLAQLNLPVGMTFDGTGNLYIADSANRRIRKVSPEGTITTVAGSGIQGYDGDSGPATDAQLIYPKDVAIDEAGNLYIADSGGHAVRMVDTTGTIWTYAGDGVSGFAGDGGPAQQARLNDPEAVEFDRAGNLYVADVRNNRVRRIDRDGTITTVAGNGRRGFSGDGGPARSASLVPVDLAFDTQGNLYIADAGNARIRKVGTDGTIITVAGGGTIVPGTQEDVRATSAELRSLKGVAVDGRGDQFIIESWRVWRVGTSGIMELVAGQEEGYSGDGGPAPESGLLGPRRAVIDAEGNLFISTSSRVRKVSGIAVAQR